MASESFSEVRPSDSDSGSGPSSDVSRGTIDESSFGRPVSAWARLESERAEYESARAAEMAAEQDRYWRTEEADRDSRRNGFSAPAARALANFDPDEPRPQLAEHWKYRSAEYERFGYF